VEDEQGTIANCENVRRNRNEKLNIYWGVVLILSFVLGLVFIYQ